MAFILVADDEASIRDVVQYALEREGHRVETVKNGREALERFGAGRAGQAPGLAPDLVPDLLILDVLMPELDGLSACRKLRERSDVPVIFLSSRGEEVDRILGLELGGDDYLTKPFSPAELVARVQALLRRQRALRPLERHGVIHTGDLAIDSARRVITVGGLPVELTALEFAILAALARDPGVVLARQQLLDAAWGIDFLGDEHVLEVHVGNLRRKLGDDPASPRYIETVRGTGYRLLAEAR
jgi:DNA-binding response OmpR family regulator